MGWSGYEIVGVIPGPCCVGCINEGSECIVSTPDGLRLISTRTDKRVREFFLIGHIHVQHTSHVFLREKVVHDCGW